MTNEISLVGRHRLIVHHMAWEWGIGLWMEVAYVYWNHGLHSSKVFGAVYLF